MLERLSPTARNLALAALAVLVLWFAWTVRAVLNPLLLGYLLAFVLHPLVERLEQRGWRRRPAVNLIFAIAGLSIVLVCVGLTLQGAHLVREVARPGGVADGLVDRVEGSLRENPRVVEWALAILPSEEGPPPGEGEPDPAADGEEVVGEEPVAGERVDGERVDGSGDPTELPANPEVAELMAALRGSVRELMSGDRAAKAGAIGAAAVGGAFAWLVRVFGSAVELVTLILLLPVYAYFLLFELERIHAFVRRYLPVRDRARLARVGGQMGEVLASFCRGRLVVCVIKGLVLTAGLAALDVDYALLLGMGSGFLSLIPFFGPFLGFVAAALLGTLEHGFVGALWRASVVFGAGELLEGYVLIPKVLGDSLDLHPLVVLFAVFAGGAALGMFGFIIALPLTAAIVIVAREFVLPVLGQWADEGSEEVPAPANHASGPPPPEGERRPAES